jgi:hypothetical protein
MARATLLPKAREDVEINKLSGLSGSREREFDVGVRVRPGLAVRTAGTAGLGASTQGFIDDGFDGARAPATFRAATEAAIELLGIAGKVFRGTHGTADIVVGEDVAGTDNHENDELIGDAVLTDI